MILFVDDEPGIMSSFKQFLEIQLKKIGNELVFFSQLDEAIDFFNLNYSTLDLVILDVMMPGGKSIDVKKSNGGLITGFILYQKIRIVLPDIPIVIFTNSIDEDVKTEIEKDERAKFLQKKDYVLPEFSEEIREFLK